MAAKSANTEREQAGANIRVDGSELYDLFLSLDAISTPARHPRWRQWGEAAREAYNERELQRVRRWFGGKVSLGAAFMALVPVLAESASADDLLDLLGTLPLGDFLRIVVTVGFANPETPLDAETLMGLSRNAATAEDFLGRYLGLSGRMRTDVLRVLADPEGARADLLALLRRQLALPAYAALIEETREEREQALEALREQVANDAASLTSSIVGGTSVEGFAQAIFAVSVVLDRGHFGYMQEISRSLLDGASYEPLLTVSGARRVLDGPQVGRRSADKGTPSRDTVERVARVFALLGDSSRLRMLRLLAERPHFGQELAGALGVTPASVSQQLGLLSGAGLVRAERRAHRTYYVLQRDALAAAFASGQALLELGLVDDREDEGRDTAQ